VDERVHRGGGVARKRLESRYAAAQVDQALRAGMLGTGRTTTTRRLPRSSSDNSSRATRRRATRSGSPGSSRTCSARTSIAGLASTTTGASRGRSAPT
jgi:hypothetical protein